jgi:hypothetical protein
MPSASDALRNKMIEYFGDDGVDMYPAATYLQSQGIVDQGGHFRISEQFPLTSKMLNCLNFLHEEWDFDWKWEGIV